LSIPEQASKPLFAAFL